MRTNWRRRDGLEKLLVLVAQVQDHFGAAIRLVVAPESRTGPSPSESQRTAARVRALGQHRDFVGDDECGIETDAELTDQLRVLGGIAAQGLEEFLGAGARDRAEIVDDFRLAHADAVVLDGQGAGRRVRESA